MCKKGAFVFVSVVVVLLSMSMSFVESGDADGRVLTKESRYTVNETINRLVREIESGPGGRIFARIDQKKAAEEAGLINQLEDTEVLLFGNPRVGTELMVANGLVSIELPLRASAWKRNNRVYLSIVNPNALEMPFNLSSKKDVLQRMTTNVQQLLDKVSS
jgi:uncharacterized protein (DUF302 family)